MRVVLGISAYYHDSAATLLIDGIVVAAAQEERFSRRKNDERFPVNAVNFCLSKESKNLKDIDAVVFYDKPIIKFSRMLEGFWQLLRQVYLLGCVCCRDGFLEN